WARHGIRAVRPVEQLSQERLPVEEWASGWRHRRATPREPRAALGAQLFLRQRTQLEIARRCDASGNASVSIGQDAPSILLLKLEAPRARPPALQRCALPLSDASGARRRRCTARRWRQRERRSDRRLVRVQVEKSPHSRPGLKPGPSTR